MKKYNVVLMPSALGDIEESYHWGVKQWGAKRAEQWAKSIKKAALSLSAFPERQPIAPENDQFEEEVRHLVIGRYRLLYNIEDETVYVLHCIGGFTGEKIH